MKAIGLQPSSTGMVGGKETGQQMTHYIIPGGAFAQAFAKLAATGWKLNLQSAHRAGGKKAPNSKTKFTCPSCAQNAWGKPDLAISCTPCGLDMLAERNAAAVDPLPVLSYDPEIVVAIDSPAEASPAKRKRERPRGSKTKPKQENTSPSYDAKPRRKSRHDKHVNIAAE